MGSKHFVSLSVYLVKNNIFTLGISNVIFKIWFPDKNRIIKLFNESKFDVCKIFYNKFKNVITQIPQEQQIIPIENKKTKEQKNMGMISNPD